MITKSAHLYSPMATQFMCLCDQVTVTLTRLWYHDLLVPTTGDSFDWAVTTTTQLKCPYENECNHIQI